jgi:Kef-type K+ transport system membrane component KefB
MTVAEFLVALIAIFLAAKVFGELAERIGQPAVLGELVGGVVVGVSGLQLVDPHDVTIHLLSELGVILLLFLIGLETDLKRLLSVGGSATTVAIVGVVLPFIGGFAFGYALGFRIIVAALLGASLTATSVGITARVLSDLGHLQDAESQVILGAAVVDDIIGLVLLTIISTLADGGAISAIGIGRIALVAFGFVILAIVIGSRLAPYLIRVIEKLDVARGLFYGALIFALALAYIASRVGSAVIIGSFAAGLVLARTRKGEDIEHDVHDVAQFFIPIFFVVVGAAVDLRSLNPMHADSRMFLMVGLALTGIGIVGKVLAGFAAVQRGLSRTIIGVGMIPRGEVGLIFAQIGLTTKLLTPGLYSAVALMVILTTFVTPLVLRVMLPRGVPTELHGESDFVMDAPMDGAAGKGPVTSAPSPPGTRARP